ncbi:MAG: hypothetical protein QM504_10830 [Pseudomonadota bacterium]
MNIENTFREEADELLIDLEATILKLEEQPGDSDCITVNFVPCTQLKALVQCLDSRNLPHYQAVIKGIGKMYENIKDLAGATILGDGTVALILDTNVLIQNASRINKTLH